PTAGGTSRPPAAVLRRHARPVAPHPNVARRPGGAPAAAGRRLEHVLHRGRGPHIHGPHAARSARAVRLRRPGRPVRANEYLGGHTPTACTSVRVARTLAFSAK